jgi:hypothetical protein
MSARTVLLLREPRQGEYEGDRFTSLYPFHYREIVHLYHKKQIRCSHIVQALHVTMRIEKGEDSWYDSGKWQICQRKSLTSFGKSLLQLHNSEAGRVF